VGVTRPAVPAVVPARRAAHRVVVRTLAEGAWTDRALRAEAAGLQPRDRALAKRLAFGTVQRRLTLDWVIDGATGPRGARLEPGVRAALQLGLFQLLFLDGVAAHAAIGEAVELAKPSPGHRLVNAVLRRVQRDGVELPADDAPAGAAIRHSHPEWLVRLWWDELGAEETRALLAADNEPAELCLRVNTLVTGDPPDGVAGRRAGDALVVDGPADLEAHPGWAAGAFLVQSRASQLVSELVAPRPGERVLDLCAAPGGKTTHLAALMGGEGEVVAVERHAGRALALRRTCERLRARNVTVVEADGTAFRDPIGFDRVLVDPPCSGLGTLRSHPDLRWRADPARIPALAALQDGLLEAARANLRPSGPGVLAYAVCTISRAEERLRGTERRRTLPHRDGTDGFYIARDGRG
jgi:16S rRNA (cytosine967-C5)-methyltransferase